MVYPPHGALSTCSRPSPSLQSNPTVAFDSSSPLPALRRVVAGAATLAALGQGVVLARTGAVEWPLVTLLLTLSAAWAFWSQLYDLVLAPLGRFLNTALTGRVITLEDEIADLEGRLAGRKLPPRREILATIRLAEIYREKLFDKPRADALLDRLLVKYPDSPELRFARRLVT